MQLIKFLVIYFVNVANIQKKMLSVKPCIIIAGERQLGHSFQEVHHKSTSGMRKETEVTAANLEKRSKEIESRPSRTHSIKGLHTAK